MGGGEIFEGEISVSKFKYPPQIFGGGLLGATPPPKKAAAHKAAAGIAAADQCRHLLVCFAMYPRWAPAASFARFCILIVWLYLFLQLLRRHGGADLSNPYKTAVLKAKFGITLQQ